MSFEELVKRISPKLKSIAFRLNGHFSFFNEEDLYQESLLHLWGDFQEGKLETKNDAYIVQGCFFHLKNYLRKVRIKANLVSLDALVNNEEDTTFQELLSLESPQRCFDYLDCRSLIERIQNDGLTKREKEVFNLSLDGLTTREIGKRLGISHVRVVKLRKRIKNKCQKFKGK